MHVIHPSLAACAWLHAPGWCLRSAVADRVYALFKLPANATEQATPIDKFPPGTLFRVGLVRAVL